MFNVGKEICNCSHHLAETEHIKQNYRGRVVAKIIEIDYWNIINRKMHVYKVNEHLLYVLATFIASNKTPFDYYRKLFLDIN